MMWPIQTFGQGGHMNIVLATACLVTTLTLSLPSGVIAQVRTPPNPVLNFVGQQSHTTAGKTFVRYRYEVSNASAFPDEMFAPSPELPPCGNTKSARTWVDLYAQNGMRLYGFCALKSSAELNSIFFTLPEGEMPPSWIYIELHDRKLDNKNKSNLAETTN
jgi:hypothetical protein